MESALGLALMQMSGSRQIVLSGDPPAKAIYGAFPNQAGVMAALLAKEGLGAKCDVFGPPAGLYAAIYGGDCVASVLSEELVIASFSMTQNSSHGLPVIRCIRSSRRPCTSSREFRPLRSHLLKLHVTAACGRGVSRSKSAERPDNAAAAADSIQFCVAAALIYGEVTLTTFTAEVSTMRMY